MKSTKSDTALIKGASSGIGLALAREFARHGHPLVIVAPVKSELDEIATMLTAEFAVTVHPVAQDLARSHSVDEIFEDLMKCGHRGRHPREQRGFGAAWNFWRRRSIATSRSFA